MKEFGDGDRGLFDEMVEMGLISTGNLWIKIAIEQKSTRLPLAIASSRLLSYDQIDRKLASLMKLN